MCVRACVCVSVDSFRTKNNMSLVCTLPFMTMMIFVVFVNDDTISITFFQ